MIYTNSTTNYTNIDIQKSVHFAVSRTETRLKMHQTCIWNTGHMQSIAGPVHASAVWTDEKNNKTKCSYRIFIVCNHRSVPSFGPGFLCLNSWLTLPKQSLCTIFAITDISLCPGLLGYTSSGCPTVCVLARLCKTSIRTGGGKQRCLRPQCLQFTNNTYTIWPHIY